MESSANIHHQQHQLQDQYVVVGNSSALVIPSCYAAGSTHAWTPSSSTILNSGSFINACSNVGTLSSRDSWQQNNNMVLSSLDSSSMTQDLGFHWANNTAGNHITAQPPGYDLHLARVKNESSDSSCTKVNEVLSSSSQSIEDIHTASYMKINERRDLKDLNAKLLLRNFPSGYQQMNGFQLSSEDSNSSLSSSGSVTMPNRSGSFNQQIFPTLNDLNSFNQMSLANSTTLDGMNNLQSLNLFNSARFNEGLSQLSRDHHHSFYKGGFSNYGLDNMHQPSIRPLNSPNHISSSFSNGVAEAKRSSIMLEPKAPEPAPKKSRIESRSSCPPFNVMKVRKEKLGDRIAALQQLVAPFGKTDTASVLMEAIGYIKFLQNQVETLSVPYMKSSRSKTRMMQGGSAGYESEESKRDLRSRGLCLVPVSCLSYVTDGGGGVWPPPNFGGGF